MADKCILRQSHSKNQSVFWIIWKLPDWFQKILEFLFHPTEVNLNSKASQPTIAPHYFKLTFTLNLRYRMKFGQFSGKWINGLVACFVTFWKYPGPTQDRLVDCLHIWQGYIFLLYLQDLDRTVVSTEHSTGCRMDLLILRLAGWLLDIFQLLLYLIALKTFSSASTSKEG